MGKRGPKPHTKEELQARNSWRANHVGKTAQPEQKASESIDFVGHTLKKPCPLDGEAAAAWDALSSILKKSGRARTVDSYMLAALCMAWDMLQRSYMLTQTEGLTQEGKLKREPSAAAKSASEFANLVRSLASEFGFSPLGRSKIKPDSGTSTAQPAKAEAPVDAPKFNLIDFIKKGA